MNEVNVTLNEFFGLKEVKLNEAGMEAVKNQAGDAIGKFGWKAVSDGLSNAIASTFEMSLGGILAAGWSKRRELMKYLEKPEATNYLRLAKHVVNSDHKPEVEVLFNEQPVVTLQFEVKFKLEIDGANLMIHEGMMVEVVHGPLRGVIGRLIRKDAPKARLVLSVNLIGQAVSVEVDAADVKAY